MEKLMILESLQKNYKITQNFFHPKSKNMFKKDGNILKGGENSAWRILTGQTKTVWSSKMRTTSAPTWYWIQNKIT